MHLSASFKCVWGVSIASIRAKPLTIIDTIHPDDIEYVINSYQQVLKGEKQEIEFRILFADQSIHWMRSNLFSTTDEKGKQVITGLVEDFTARKESYDTLEKFAAKKNTVLEILSHDLAGPLNNIKGLSSMLASGLQQYQNPHLDKIVGMITKTSERSIHLIREFVKEEFLGSVNSSFVKYRVNIVQKVREFMDQYKNSEINIAKTFTFTASHDDIFMMVDDYKFGQAINNLISNSIKFTNDGGVIDVTIKDQQESVLFIVADNGIGIPEKYQDGLFDRFTQARRPGLKGEPSVGLGMSIIKIIVEWHDGKIWFESQENVGTTFYIELPKA